MVTLSAPQTRIELMNLRSIFYLGAAIVALNACSTDTINDRRSGQLIVCHKEDKTLNVSNADSFVHLDHGDTPGPCAEKDPQE